MTRILIVQINMKACKNGCYPMLRSNKIMLIGLFQWDSIFINHLLCTTSLFLTYLKMLEMILFTHSTFCLMLWNSDIFERWINFRLLVFMHFGTLFSQCPSGANLTSHFIGVNLFLVMLNEAKACQIKSRLDLSLAQLSQ